MDDLNAVLVFLKVAEQGGFVAAARYVKRRPLGIAQFA
jgi:DNA-binding transcriptional LysR family regulator